MVRSWWCAAALVFVGISSAAAQDVLYVTGKPGNIEITLKKPDVDPEILGANPAEDIFPRYSRDGAKIAFSSNRDGLLQIYTMDPAGAGVAQISLERRGRCTSPSWSPTGNHIVYQHSSVNKRADLVVIKSDGEEWRPIVHNAWQPDWSPLREKGDRIAFVSGVHDAGLFIYTCEPDGSDIRAIHKLRNTLGLVHPIWSPEATLIAFTDGGQKGHEIFTCGPDGENVRQLTALGRKNVYPVWSPDGKRVFFWHEREDHAWQWMSVDIESRKVEPYDIIPTEAFIRGGRMAIKE